MFADPDNIISALATTQQLYCIGKRHYDPSREEEHVYLEVYDFYQDPPGKWRIERMFGLVRQIPIIATIHVGFLYTVSNASTFRVVDDADDNK